MPKLPFGLFRKLQYLSFYLLSSSLEKRVSENSWNLRVRQANEESHRNNSDVKATWLTRGSAGRQRSAPKEESVTSNDIITITGNRDRFRVGKVWKDNMGWAEMPKLA